METNAKCFTTSQDFFKRTNDNKYKYKVDISDDLQTIKCNKRIYILSSLLGQGSYGKIYFFKTIDGLEDNVVLKIEYTKKINVPTEKKISEVLEEESCGTVLLRYIKSINQTSNHFYVMNKMSGDLTGLINNVVLPNKNNGGIQGFLLLIEDIRSQISCLAKKGYYYTDLKPGNVLYCNEDNGSITVSLGDLGSVHSTHRYQIATFPPPEYSDSKGYFMVKEIKHSEILSWVLGCLTASIVISHIHILGWNNGKKINQNVTEIVEQLEIQYKKYMTPKQIDLIKRMLSINPNERPNIHQPFYEFIEAI